jgi:hypothetical protein
MSPRAFVFSVWVANGKKAAATVTALETIAANVHSVTSEAGRLMISASTGGKSFSYTLPPDMTPSTVGEMALQCWNIIRAFTDAELETWLTRRNPKTMIAGFNYPLN